MSLALLQPYIEKLSSTHDVNHFDCGAPDLNRFLISHALQNQQAGSANSYVACYEQSVIGYYSLAVSSIIHAKAPVRVKKGLAKHPIPVMLLARLAVDVSQHGKGIGRGLLKDALLRTVQSANIAGIRALLVHAKDDAAKQWYEQFNFDPSPTDPLHMFLLMKDIRKIVNYG